MYKGLQYKTRVQVGQYAVDVREAPKSGSQVVVLLHGVGVASTYYLPFAHELAREFHVIAIDLPGYGSTPKPPRPLAVDELADVVATYLDEAGLNQVVIIGQSMGCQIAAHVASAHPSLCAKLILLGPTVNRRERNLYMQGLRLLQDCFYEPPRLNMTIIRDYLSMGIIRYLRTARHMVADRIEDRLRHCRVPTLIVRGSKDRISPSPWVRYLRDHSSNASVKEIPDAPHVVQFTNPKALFVVCREFIGL